MKGEKTHVCLAQQESPSRRLADTLTVTLPLSLGMVSTLLLVFYFREVTQPKIGATAKFLQACWHVHVMHVLSC